MQNLAGTLSVLNAVPEAPVFTGDVAAYASAYSSYVEVFRGCQEQQKGCLAVVSEAVSRMSVDGPRAAAGSTGEAAGFAETVASWLPGVGDAAKELYVDGKSFGVAVAECAEEPAVCATRGKNYLRNQAKKLRKKANKAASSVGGTVAGRQGYFSECDPEVQAQLRESRATMLVARNKAAARKAEAEERRVAAQMKSQEIERVVELKRLRVEGELQTALDRKFGVDKSTGFAETVVSEGLTEAISVPDLSGSVSPDSSVSVAVVRKMEQTIAKQAEALREVRGELALLKKFQGVEPVRDAEVGGRVTEAEYLEAMSEAARFCRGDDSQLDCQPLGLFSVGSDYGE